ncbi:hypothetical protein BJ508DRAFT_419249 [Ascobolus immersus RN42]|uniref:Uncharacterized protein n=1 Tax=Ascobolus immersus RN42 TaxID=1160509 RepID=A0A3N4HL98_ASCIM|nr:hypothetical protein BJ508DRAFT_419249 [Ascobolus immersus RN42]
MASFSTLPYELHHEIASHLIPPLSEEYEVHLPKIALKYSPELGRAWKEWELEDVLPEGCKLFKGVAICDIVADTTSLIAALDGRGRQSHSFLRHLCSIYTISLCKFLKGFILKQFHLMTGLSTDEARHYPSGCFGRMHTLQWMLMFQAALDAFEALHDDQLRNRAEYDLWQTFFLTVWPSNNTSNIFKLDSIQLHQSWKRKYELHDNQFTNCDELDILIRTSLDCTPRANIGPIDDHSRTFIRGDVSAGRKTASTVEFMLVSWLKDAAVPDVRLSASSNRLSHRMATRSQKKNPERSEAWLDCSVVAIRAREVSPP